ncbi:MAG: response regulator [Candidatus Omnitrophota bacterium]
MAYKLLVVDDDKAIVEMIEKRLTQEEYDVVVAYDGEEALSKIREDNPDVILLDLMMPKKNGFEVIKEVRTNIKDKWRPIIIVSAKNDLDSIKMGYSMEADHYLTKPCSMDNLLRGIRTMISLIPARKEG